MSNLVNKPLISSIIVIGLSFLVIEGNGESAKDVCKEQEGDPFLYDTFPEGFLWGFATASYQIEGGWDADEKGESIWDAFTHGDWSPVVGRANGDIACNSYEKYPEDVQMLVDTGSDFYRFSISWSRILPNGTIDYINKAGITYYNNLINALLEKNITPMVTIYHWDLPNALQLNYGGWVNEELIVHYTNYARLLFETYGDRVKHWFTFNEPFNTCELGYGVGIAAPGNPLNLPGREPTEPYKCAHTVLKSHASAYRMYEREFKAEQQGLVGIVIDSEWKEPKDPNNANHHIAAERARRFKHGWFGFPVFFGDYPPEMREYVDAASHAEGRNQSRLPTFDTKWKNLLRGSLDFLGVNHYTTQLISSVVVCPLPGWYCDQQVTPSNDESWEGSGAAWLKKVPWGLRKLLNWVKDTYDNPLVFITENGWSDEEDAGLDDQERICYFRDYINNVLKAIKVDGCNVKAYTAWSLMDNFEWINGYTHRFGSYYVDFTDPERPRTPKESAGELKKIFDDNGFPGPAS